jgi:hypothetical protein
MHPLVRRLWHETRRAEGDGMGASIEFHLTWFTMGVYDMATTIPYPYST